jgi:hypothetical protein
MPATAEQPLVYRAAVPWANGHTSQPLMDFRHVWGMGKGTPYRYDRTARAYLSRPTLWWAQQNRNCADLYGRRTTACFGGPSPFPDFAHFWSDMLAGDDLPTLYVAGPGEGPRDGLVIVVPLLTEGGADPLGPLTLTVSPEDVRTGAGHRYALRPVGEPPPGVALMWV